MQNNHESELLVTTDWLAAHLGDHNIRVVDTRKGDGYEVAHVPGAVRYPAAVTPFLKENGRVPSADSFAALMSEIGVGDEDLVVAYDDGNNLFAARLWWALNYYGHRRVKLVDGGWDLWLAEGRPVADAPVSARPARFTPKIDDHCIAEWETYCQGGIRAAHTAFALRLASYDQVRNYERSWSEWGNREDLPIERPYGRD